MTRQAVWVFKNTDFPVSIYKDLEMKLCKHTAPQIIDLVWRKDKAGIHDWEWFAPFFKGYLHRMRQVEIDFDDMFWKIYDLLSCHLKSWDVTQMPYVKLFVDEKNLMLCLPMASDLGHLKQLYCGMPKFNIPSTFKKMKVNKRELDSST